MKIEIQQADNSGTYDYKVYDLNNKKLIRNDNNTQMRNLDHYFSDEDILNLLDNKQYSQFQNGKFIFEVTKKQIFAVTNNINYFTMPK